MSPLNGSNSPDSLLNDARQEKNDVLDQNILKRWETWKGGVAERTGLSFGGDYTAVGFYSTESLGDDTAASGIMRIFGSWELLNRGAPNTGSFEFKVETRNRYTDVTPQLFGAEVGYLGTPQPVFNNDGFRVTNLYWKQSFNNGRGIVRIGFLDSKDFFDLYALASPWNGFGNLAFSVGSNTQSILPDGALGAMVGGYVSDNFYLAASIMDANFDPTDVFKGFDTFFNDFETFKTLEFGYTAGGKRFFLDNAHLAFWQLDDSEEKGAPGGWGVNASVSRALSANTLAWLRGGWADGGGGAYEASISTGFAYLNKPGGNLLGVGLNWGRPNSDTVPLDLDDQWTGEAFYRVQLTENIQITPSVQLLVDPALNPDEDFIALFGLRARLTF